MIQSILFLTSCHLLTTMGQEKVVLDKGVLAAQVFPSTSGVVWGAPQQEQFAIEEGFVSMGRENIGDRYVNNYEYKYSFGGLQNCDALAIYYQEKLLYVSIGRNLSVSEREVMVATLMEILPMNMIQIESEQKLLRASYFKKNGQIIAGNLKQKICDVDFLMEIYVNKDNFNATYDAGLLLFGGCVSIIESNHK